jgi:hypothetical protein
MLLLLGPAAARAEAPALLTVVDGAAPTVIDGARALVAQAGMRLSAAALIDTLPGTSLVRVEFNDGSTLDLGPDTRVMLLPPGLAGSGPKAPAFYLMQGWAKHSTPAKGGGAGQLSPQLEVSQIAGVTVGRVSGDEALLFIEAGKVQLLERRLKGAPPLNLKAGEQYGRTGSDKGSISPRPSAALLQGLPRSFRDTLPPLAAQFKGKVVEGRPAPAPGYAQLKPWLTAEPALRREFPRRFLALAQEPSFRDGLVKNLSAHPEWEPILFPKPASPPAR